MQYKSKKTDVVCSIWKRAHGYFSIYVSKTDSAWQETDSKRVNLKGTEVAKKLKSVGLGELKYGVYFVRLQYRPSGCLQRVRNSSKLI